MRSPSLTAFSLGHSMFFTIKSRKVSGVLLGTHRKGYQAGQWGGALLRCQTRPSRNLGTVVTGAFASQAVPSGP